MAGRMVFKSSHNQTNEVSDSTTTFKATNSNTWLSTSARRANNVNRIRFHSGALKYTKLRRRNATAIQPNSKLSAVYEPTVHHNEFGASMPRQVIANCANPKANAQPVVASLFSIATLRNSNWRTANISHAETQMPISNE